MNGRSKRTAFTSADIEAHLSQLSIDTTSHGNENLEALAPLVISLQHAGTEAAYLRSLDKFVEEREKNIEEICGDNYEDFVSSVSTLLTVRQGTVHLRRRIGELDGQMGDVGRALGEKKRALLQQRMVARNVDEAIETLQSCLRLLDGVNKVGDLIKQGHYFAGLRSLEEMNRLPPSAISETPFYQHIVSSLPSLRAEIKSAVTESEKSWLFDVRQSGATVGRLALDHMEARQRRWRTKKEREREKEGVAALTARSLRVGSAVELVNNEKVEFDPLQNDQIHIDFKPLFQCVHIYQALDCKSELQRKYQEDRKTQAALILSQRSAAHPTKVVADLPALMEELVGFFIIESYVLRATRDFRSQRDVDDLWSDMYKSIVQIVGDALKACEETEVFLTVKGHVLTFIQTLEGYGYDVKALTALLLTLFERYSNLLQRKFSADFDQIIEDDDNQPMMVNDQREFDQVVGVCWLATGQAESIAINGFPQAMPFSQTFPMCCINIRNLVDQFYQFVEGVDQHHADIDELLRKSLDGLLISHVSKNICTKLSAMRNLSQIAQMVINIEHFIVACDELETVLMTLRSGPGSSRAGVISLQSGPAFVSTLEFAQRRIDEIIASKLDDFFEMAEYDWLPKPVGRTDQGGRSSPALGRSSPMPFSPTSAGSTREPSTYLFEMITFLTAYVDSVLIMLSETTKTQTYRNALEHVRAGLMSYLVGPDPPKYNEQALKNLLDDVLFIEREVKRLEKPGLDNVFDEIKSSIGIILSDAVSAYLEPSIRQTSYAAVKPKNLGKMLEKLSLAKVSGTPGSMVTAADVERMQRRRREAEAVAKLA